MIGSANPRRRRPLPAAGMLLSLLLILLPAAAVVPAQEEPLGPVPDRLPADGLREDLVLIHGLGSSAGVWDQVIPRLIGGYRVFTYEMPGHGVTRPIADPTLDQVVSHFQAYLAAQSIENPYLVGHGMGGLVALKHALAHPGDVRRLVLLDVAPRQLATAEEKTAVTEQILDDYDRFVASRFLNMSQRPEVADRIVDQALRTDSASLITLLMSSFDFDIREDLARMTVPILVVGSELYFPAGTVPRERLLAMGWDRAHTVSLKRLDGCGHFAMLEAPGYLANIIAGFAHSPHGN